MAALDSLIDTIPDAVVAICRRLRDTGKRGWVVGGCVRDLLRGGAAADWDVATDATPDEVQQRFKKVVPTGIEHGTVTVIIGRVPYEVTTLRGEGEYLDGRRPTSVAFHSDIEADLARRDFTFNAIAIDPIERTLIDPFGGRADLDAKVLRAVGDPLARFTEDGLRIMRAARFAANLGCTLDPPTKAAMAHADAHATLAKVSVERVHDEWHKIMRGASPSVGFDLMRTTGVLAVICPELAATAEDDWQRAMRAVDACAPDAALRIAALLHALDVDLAEGVLRRMKFSIVNVKRIVALLHHKRPAYGHDWTDARVRRWLRAVTPEHLADVCALATALADDDVAKDGIARLAERARAMVDAGVALETRDLAIGGKELMVELGLKPSKRLGEILAALLEGVLDDPSLNEPRALLDVARSLIGDAS